MSNYERQLLAFLNGICETAMTEEDVSPGENLECLLALEEGGLRVPPYLRQAVLEFVVNNFAARRRVYGGGRASHVYFILDHQLGAVKIGFTTAPKLRLSQMQSHNSGVLELLALISGGADVEKAMHKRFDHLRVRGEWFRYEGELKDYISSLPDGSDDGHNQQGEAL